MSLPTNPAAAVRGPRHIVRRGKTPVLDPAEARQLIDAIDTTTVIGLRDRALIGLMVYSFARIGAAIGMRVEDVYTQNRRLWVRLHEKGGKQHAMPCHHNLESYLHAYIDGAGLANDPKALLFQTYSRASGRLTGGSTRPASEFSAPNFALSTKGKTDLRPFPDTARRMATRSRYDWAHRFCVRCGLAATISQRKSGMGGQVALSRFRCGYAGALQPIVEVSGRPFPCVAEKTMGAARILLDGKAGTRLEAHADDGESL